MSRTHEASASTITEAPAAPTWDTIRFAPPLLSLGAILLVVFLASLATTYPPARRASRIYPAMALRCE